MIFKTARFEIDKLKNICGLSMIVCQSYRFFNLSDKKLKIFQGFYSKQHKIPLNDYYFGVIKF